ncbi:MAG TPA: SDR family oxidoreductase [Candidatus Omnitrophota bacterium]|nr:SDR family oxidoreductase [Candidatus Omnitrophota bacterium]HRZ15630.1 SDR family oxidoreductase [Candidatus Omnitrophota bacterium]
MRFLVTGGAGFIGSHITDKLLKDGHFVRVLDNFSSGKEENLEYAKGYPANFELMRGDICDKNTCLQATKGVDAVCHQAALRSVPKSMTIPHEYNRVNIDGTLNLLEACRENKIKRLAMASSSSVYGDVTKFPEKETFYPELISPYALSKLTDEYYCRIFSEHFGVETVCLRYFNVFGPRQALDDEYAVVIPKFIHCVLNDQQPPIFGTGKQSRDFTYIDNVVQANYLSLTKDLSLSRHCEPRRGEAILKGKVFHGVFNVANGKDTTVLQIVVLLNKILGKNIQPNFLPVRAGDVFRTNADISKIKKALGFKPQVGFEEGLRKTVEWFKAKWNK